MRSISSTSKGQGCKGCVHAIGRKQHVGSGSGGLLVMMERVRFF
jgi:hypothetical protein